MRTPTRSFLYIPTTLLLSTLAVGAGLSSTVQDLLDSVDAEVVYPFNPGFDIEKVTLRAVELPSHSWEYGTAVEALLELIDPDISVFGIAPFPVPTRSREQVAGMAYAAENIVLGTGVNGLADGDGAVGDPASLGVGAVLLGKLEEEYAGGADEEVQYITQEAPRWYNGAMSHRADVPELWADFIYMAPPFLAYYAADIDDSELLLESVRQCGLYREALRANITDAPYEGVWEHIVGPQSADPGLWSTGNAWAAAGMTRILATVTKAPIAFASSWRDEARANLTIWIQEIVDGARGAPLDDGLLRNYLNDTESARGFGEVAGSNLLAAVVYRMLVLEPAAFGDEYLNWAEAFRIKMGGVDRNGDPHITVNGTATPAVNPLGWFDTTPWTAGSPEANNFVVLMYTAWRDCILSGRCPNTSA